MKRKFYVYTPCDGNQDGVMTPKTFSEAKRLANWYHQSMKDEGCKDTRAYVIDRQSGEFAYGIGDQE